MLDRRGRRADRSILLLILIVVIVLGAGAWAVLQLRVDVVTDSLKKKQPLATLFIISSGSEAQFFEVFFYNPATRKGSLFYVPANVGSLIASIDRQDAISVLYKRSAPAAVAQKIEDLLGTPLSATVDIALPDLGKVVDLLGGVEVFIPNPVDFTQDGKRILLPSGSIRLDGDKALDFLAYKDPLESDTERVARRQKFLQALLKAMGENSSFLEQRGPFRVLRSLVKTAMPARSLRSFLSEMGRFDAERMVLQRVLGTTRSVDGQDLLFPHQNGDLLKESVKQGLAANASSETITQDAMAITVEVQNGTRTAGLASRARELLQSYDLEVLAPSNADNDQYQNTVVLDRKGNLDNARRVADIINCTRIFSKPDPLIDQAIDVTVILGKDFDGRTVK
jgi:polyisoprenyl-teichoic acid--peptidoglycan teichoic acid transferase